MKKKILSLILIISTLSSMIIAFPITASADYYTEGIYTYTVSDGKAIITSCQTSASGAIDIPSLLGGYPVTSIGDSAFYDYDGLTFITIPEGVTSIGESAFEDCTNLISITIPKTLTSIGYEAFYECNGLKGVYITDISAWCNIDFDDEFSNPLFFAEKLYVNNRILTEFTAPKEITEIRDYAFYNCITLSNIEISDSVTEIGAEAFYGTGYYNNPSNWENDVLYIGNHLIKAKNTLSGNYNIKPETRTIGVYAFRNCTSLTSVEIPDSVTYIGWVAFCNCTSLTSIDIPDSVTRIGSRAFEDCTGLKSITIGNSVTNIDGRAFYNCTSLKSVYITDISAWCNIIFVGEYSNPLYYAEKLYVNNQILTEFTAPKEITEIGPYAFYNCITLSNIEISDSVTEIGAEAFYGTGYYNNPSNWENDILYIGNHLVEARSSASGIYNIKAGTKTISGFAFYGFTDMVGLIIPESVKYIGGSAFYGCTNLKTVIYEGEESMLENALNPRGNESLTNSIIIYNATKKTYKFETNCEKSLPNITDYAVFTSPTVSNDGKTLLGWYDNEKLSGTPVTFPYHGNATTLYAAWSDRTGASFEDAFIAKANQEYTVTIKTAGEYVYYEFVPTKTKQYRFYTTGSKDTYGYLYGSNKSRITSNDDGGDGNNFYISYDLTAGKTYYIAVKMYSGTGTFTLVVEEPIEYRINEITLKDMSGNSLQSIPTGTFLATVSFTNVSLSENTLIILAKYTEAGAFKGMMYIQTENVPVGSTIKLSIPVDNADGDVAKLKAFCLKSFDSLVPLANAVSFPAE